jgi:hypothetical protein
MPHQFAEEKAFFKLGAALDYKFHSDILCKKSVKDYFVSKKKSVERIRL